MSDTVPRNAGLLSRDAKGTPVETMSTREWAPKSVAVTNAAWVRLDAGTPRNHLLVNTLPTATSILILAPAETGYSNDLTNAACGIPISPGSSIELDFTDNLPVWGRVEVGGAALRAFVAEAL